MYKMLNGLYPDIMQDIFETRSNYYNTHNSPYFPQEILKQLIWFTDDLLNGSKNLEHCTERDELSYYSE